MSTIKAIERQLKALGNPTVAAQSARFFKTGKGDYGEGDRFIGIRVPVIRTVATEHAAASMPVVLGLLTSPMHEIRLAALLIMVIQRKKASASESAELYRFYLGNTSYINNWDLVDLTAPSIVGGHLYGRNRRKLYTLAKSKNLWERRIAILATFYFIRESDFGDALALADILLNDQHDLIHKAVGWMLREIGNRDLATEEGFLKPRYRNMPRTMLRYAIEKFPEKKRQGYLKGSI